MGQKKRPADIPRDVWNASLENALDWYSEGAGYYYECARHFAMTVMEERERCAKVAEDYAKQFPEYPEFDEAHNNGMSIAAAIRGGK